MAQIGLQMKAMRDELGSAVKDEIKQSAQNPGASYEGDGEIDHFLTVLEDDEDNKLL